TVAATTTDRHRVRNGLVAGVIGLVLGLALAAIREVFDERVRTTEEIERVTGLPVLAELPRDQRAKQQPSRVAVFVSPRSALSEATRALRAGIELRDVDHHPSSILITSAASGEGKSLVSANLAAAYAVAGHRTVLVDADLRTPRLSSMFGTYPEPLIATGEVVHGLSSLLRALTFPGADRPGLEQAALLRTPVDNLLVLPAGPEPANPAELLDSRAMADLLADLGAFADVIIIDAPPMLPVSDAVGLARHADGVVLVAAVGESDRRALRRISLMLAAHPRVLGIVVNKVAASASYAMYVPRRRGASIHPSATSGTLRVVRPISVAMPPTGTPDENGDMWIDLSEDTDPYLTVREGELQLNSWGR
ncbi:MAG: polysaccharide biosynthesis tyrosine autokinase, partial [Acidimicrobiia bacterium]